MPPLEGSKNAHEQVDGLYEDAENALQQIQTDKEKHEEVNATARHIMRHYGIYSDQTSVVATPWVYNAHLEEGSKRTAYQLRASNATPEHDDFGEIGLIVRVSRPNPVNPNALLTHEEVRARINCSVIFSAGDVIFDTYAQSQGKGVESSRPASPQERFPVAAMRWESQQFQDTVDTLSLMEQFLPTR